jgi:cell division protein FtsN
MNMWKTKSYWLLVAWLASGCAFMSDSAVKKPAPTGLIATPESYYSTAKARYLGSKYKDNLDRLTERIVRNSTTSQLQFANNISSVGGIGFFTHSATKTPDERYLEVVLAMPETFETKGEYSDKVNQLFSRYGYDLLSILAGDGEIYEDKELAGYGLNLTWRNVISDSPANRVTLARAIIYFHKERVANFLRRKVSGNELLGDAVIFAMEDDGPLNLVSYQPREIKPDFRPAIREDNLVAGTPAAKSSAPPQSAAEAAKPSGQKLEVDATKRDMPASPGTAGSQSAGENPQVDPSAFPTPDSLLISQPVENAKIAEQPAPARLDAEQEKLARAKQPVEARSIKPVPETILPKPASPNLSESALKLERPKDTGKAPVAAAAPIAKAEPAKLPSEKTLPEPHRAENAASKPLADSPKQTPSPRAEISLPQKPAETPAAETKNIESQSKRAENREKPAVADLAPKPASVPAVPKLQEAKSAEIAATSSPVAETPAPRSVERKVPAIAPPPAKTEMREPAIEPVPSAVASTSKEASKAAQKPAAAPVFDAAKQTPSPAIALAPMAKSPAPVEVKAVDIPKAPVEETKIETKSRAIGAPLAAKTDAPAAVAVAPESVRVAEIKRPEIAAVRPPAEKPVETPVARKAEPAAPPPVAKTEVREAIKPAPVPVVAPNQERVVPAAGTTKVTEVRRPEMAAARPPTEKPAEILAANKTEPAPPPTLKTEAREMNKPAVPAPVIAPKQDRIVATPAPEQLALARTPSAPSVESAPLARPAPKPLQGFIIQVAFADKQKAQSWAEKMTQRGYAVSVTEAGAEGALRVRLGNFSLREEAERQLQSFKQEGMSGIIINLPQAFRPEARSSLP